MQNSRRKPRGDDDFACRFDVGLREANSRQFITTAAAYWMPAFAGMTVSETMSKPPRAFHHIDTWVFDLDNTLYPHHVNLWQQVDARIGEFVSGWLEVDATEARRIQKDYYRRYGTTMRGMMTEHRVQADD